MGSAPMLGGPAVSFFVPAGKLVNICFHEDVATVHNLMQRIIQEVAIFPHRDRHTGALRSKTKIKGSGVTGESRELRCFRERFEVGHPINLKDPAPRSLN